MQASQLIFVLYDSIENSVFFGQVMEPLIKKVQENQNQTITIISFEQYAPSKEIIDKINAYSDRIKLHMVKKLSYIGSITIAYSAHRLKKILKAYASYSLIARGPIAGLISKKALEEKQCISLAIQARGLLAAEYEYAHANSKNLFTQIVYPIRLHQFSYLEKVAYSERKMRIPFTIEAVSQALKEYLFNTYQVNPEYITLACDDIPSAISQAQRTGWKTTIRSDLHISSNATVYCYNGSLKPWQCPEKIISFFKEKIAENSNVFLLILSQDASQFQALLTGAGIPAESYHVMHVAHKDMYPYLAACDVGILFREQHIVNWVSRPTKALEYQAVGLQILHNNTVAWLVENH